MKIRISDISANGLTIHDTLPLAALNTRMNEGRFNDIEFTAAPIVDITVYRTLTGAETKGRVITRYTQPCSLCSKVIERELEIAAEFLLKQRPPDHDANSERFEDDIGISYFNEDHIDLEELIQENLILALDIYWRPEVNADGSCQGCGQLVLINEKQSGAKSGSTLGALIEQARKKSS